MHFFSDSSACFKLCNENSTLLSTSPSPEFPVPTLPSSPSTESESPESEESDSLLFSSSDCPGLKMSEIQLLAKLRTSGIVDEEEGNVGTENSGDGDVDNNVEFSLQSLKQALESEKSASELVDKFSDTLKMQEELGNERFARKRLEEDVLLLKQHLRECESKVTGHLEILVQNKLISADLDVSQQHVADLLVQNESFQKEIDILDHQLEIDAENIREAEQKKIQQRNKQVQIPVSGKRQNNSTTTTRKRTMATRKTKPRRRHHALSLDDSGY